MKIEVSNAGSMEREIRRCLRRLKPVIPDWVDYIHVQCNKLEPGTMGNVDASPEYRRLHISLDLWTIIEPEDLYETLHHEVMHGFTCEFMQLIQDKILELAIPDPAVRAIFVSAMVRALEKSTCDLVIMTRGLIK